MTIRAFKRQHSPKHRALKAAETAPLADMDRSELRRAIGLLMAHRPGSARLKAAQTEWQRRVELPPQTRWRT